MEFQPDSPVVCLAVVALGWTDRLERCLDALRNHVTRRPFEIVVVVNPFGERPIPAQRGARILTPEANLGWAGGLHLARAHTSAPLLVWVQDDMIVAEGWLDALLDAADAHPEISAFGSLMIDESGLSAGFNGGRATPPDDVASWNTTDTTRFDPPSDVTTFDWIASKGLLVRTSAWDAVGGADPRNYPLNHVDKEFCTHLRAHGLQVALAPLARLEHPGGGSKSAPSSFRVFLTRWQEPRFNSRWSDVVRALAKAPAGSPVDHPCGDWRAEGSDDPVTRAVGVEASRMLVAYASWQQAAHAHELDEVRASAIERIERYSELARAVGDARRVTD